MADNRKPDEIATELEIKRKTGDEYIKAIFGALPEGTLGAEGLQAAKDAWLDLAQHHERRMKDQTLPAAGRLQSSAQYARRRLDAADAKLAKEIAMLGDIGVQLARDMSDHLAPPASAGMAALHGEIRAQIRAMPAADRLAHIEKADAMTKAAIASAPPSLSGITPQSHERLREAYLESLDPNAAQKLRHCSDALDALTRARQAMHHHANGLIDFRSAEEISKLAS